MIRSLLPLLFFVSQPCDYKSGEHWTATATKIDHREILLWRWKGEVVGIGVYARDDNGNLLGAWGYLDKLTPQQIAVVKSGDVSPLPFLDYVPKRK